jgi:hypothetical protein
MINQTILNNTPNTIGIFNDLVINTQEINNLTILRNPINNLVELHDSTLLPFDILMVDACNFIKLYAKRLMEINYESVLFVGLGLGIFPYLSQDTTQDIDIVEINDDIITLCKNMGHLKPNINIIESDIYSFTTTKTYDLIVFDIWNEKDASFLQATQDLTSLFSNNLNVGGEIHFPLLNFVE